MVILIFFLIFTGAPSVSPRLAVRHMVGVRWNCAAVLGNALSFMRANWEQLMRESMMESSIKMILSQ